jgi:NAD(P)-dependent dehydrogenase (short-subunit alcohol dehydrogenase family)
MTWNRRKTAVITGASRGLGLALARELAGRGWRLIINARSTQALEAVQRELSGMPESEVAALAGSITDPIHRAALADAARRFGGVDVVVNNAGMLGPSPQPSLLDYPLDVLEEVYRTNVIAQLGVLQALRPHLRSDARIINVTSDAGVEAYEGWGGYGSSKAALEHLSAILAAENREWRIYRVDPGDMRTDMQQQAFPDDDISDRPLPEDSVPGFIALLEGNLPGGRYKAHALRREEVTL